MSIKNPHQHSIKYLHISCNFQQLQQFFTNFFIISSKNYHKPIAILCRHLLVSANKIIKLACCQVNRLACGGALASGRASGGSGSPFFFSRWDRILSITRWSSIQAMTLTDPPQWVQVSTSMLNTLFNRWAQVFAMDGIYAGFAGAKTGHGCSSFIRSFVFF